MVRQSGEGPSGDSMPWDSIQPTLLVPDRELPLEETAVRGYYWLSWDVAPEVGTHLVRYQSWERSPAPLQHALEFNCATCDWVAAGVPPEEIDEILCALTGKSCGGTAAAAAPVDAGAPVSSDFEPPVSQRVNAADNDACSLSAPGRGGGRGAWMLMLLAASVLSFASRARGLISYRLGDAGGTRCRRIPRFRGRPTSHGK